MKKAILKTTLLVFVILGTFITGCKKDEVRPAPTISFLVGGDYTSTDASVYAGDTVLVGLQCTWNGSDPIKTLTLYANDQMIGTPTDIPEDYQQGFIFNTTITKSEVQTENWVFEATDSQGEKNSVSLILSLDDSGGLIVEGLATIGAQDNTTDFGYYSLTTNLNYNAANAQTYQNLIDMLGAYDETNFLHLVSPNANNLPEPYLTEIADWTTKNATLFCSTTFGPDQFDFINRDNLLISAFSSIPDDQKNKAKDLKVGDVYSFRTGNGKFGLFKVTEVTSGASGKVSIDIKIQP
jgi:hypothetical protein